MSAVIAPTNRPPAPLVAALAVVAVALALVTALVVVDGVQRAGTVVRSDAGAGDLAATSPGPGAELAFSVSGRGESAPPTGDPGPGPDPIPAAATAAPSLRALTVPLDTALDIPEPENGPQPVSISFADIGVLSAPVDAVGVEANGEMEIPSPTRVGWYRYGPRPGEPGSAVLAAHIAAGGVDGVFRHLDAVEPGARFEVVFDDGSTATYEIVERAQYSKDELPFDRVFTREGRPVVTLITCGGEFQPSLRSYEDNVVAYAVAVPS